MREIRFRAWNKETKTMVDLQAITPLALSDTMNSQMALQGMSGVFLPFKEGWPIMQFTGLLDSKGKEIFEGDRVKTLYDHPFKFDDEAPWIAGEIEYSHGQWMVDYPDHGVSIPLVIYESDRVEVIGHIFEKEGEKL